MSRATGIIIYILMTSQQWPVFSVGLYFTCCCGRLWCIPFQPFQLDSVGWAIFGILHLHSATRGAGLFGSADRNRREDKFKRTTWRHQRERPSRNSCGRPGRPGLLLSNWQKEKCFADRSSFITRICTNCHVYFRQNTRQNKTTHYIPFKIYYVIKNFIKYIRRSSRAVQ